MKRIFSGILFLILSGFSFLSGREPVRITYQDSLDRQILYNGRVWRNLYSKVKGHPFLFSQEFLPGSVTIGGKTFNNIKIRYDIYKDEILILTDKVIILQVNKEMTDGFTINYSGVTYSFRKISAKDGDPVSGYINVVYEKNTQLLVKYRKEIDTGGSDNLDGTFLQGQRIFVKKGEILRQISSRHEFLKLLDDRKAEIRNYIRTNKVSLSKANPSGFAFVLAYYDTLK